MNAGTHPLHQSKDVKTWKENNRSRYAHVMRGNAAHCERARRTRLRCIITRSIVPLRKSVEVTSSYEEAHHSVAMTSAYLAGTYVLRKTQQQQGKQQQQQKDALAVFL